MEILNRAETWIIIAALSEIIALSPLKDNSVVQLVMTAINSIKPSKKDWAIYLLMEDGYLDLTHVQIMKEYAVWYSGKNSMQLCLENLILPRKIGTNNKRA